MNFRQFDFWSTNQSIRFCSSEVLQRNKSTPRGVQRCFRSFNHWLITSLDKLFRLAKVLFKPTLVSQCATYFVTTYDVTKIRSLSLLVFLSNPTLPLVSLQKTTGLNLIFHLIFCLSSSSGFASAGACVCINFSPSILLQAAEKAKLIYFLGFVVPALLIQSNVHKVRS